MSSNAVDGSSNPDFNLGKSCSSTQRETNPWWKLDLLEIYDVTITVITTPETQNAPMKDLEIRVGNNDKKPGSNQM